jgi:DNA-binding transcriptional ArsR family regulator
MTKPEQPDIALYGRMLAAMGSEPRLRIMQLLVSAGPRGMIVMEIQARLGVPGSTLSHHLEKLRNAGLAGVQRQHCCLRYSANVEVLQDLLAFLNDECGLKSPAVKNGKAIGNFSRKACC